MRKRKNPGQFQPGNKVRQQTLSTITPLQQQQRQQQQRQQEENTALGKLHTCLLEKSNTLQNVGNNKWVIANLDTSILAIYVALPNTHEREIIFHVNDNEFHAVTKIANKTYGSPSIFTTHEECCRLLQQVTNIQICCGVSFTTYNSIAKALRLYDEEAVIDSTIQVKRIVKNNCSEIMQTQIRSVNCSLKVDANNVNTCEACAALELKLNRSKHSMNINSNNVLHYSREQLLSAYIQLKAENEQYEQIITTLEYEKDQLSVQLNDNTLNDDLVTILLKTINMGLLPETSFVRRFFLNQLQAILVSTSSSMKWHPEVIRWALKLQLLGGNKSYEAIQGSKAFTELKLPSSRLLRYYKHEVFENPGWNEQSFAKLLSIIKEVGSCGVGGFAHDAMYIKQGLVWKKNNDNIEELIGWTDDIEAPTFENIADTNEQESEMDISVSNSQSQYATRSNSIVEQCYRPSQMYVNTNIVASNNLNKYMRKQLQAKQAELAEKKQKESNNLKAGDRLCKEILQVFFISLDKTFTYPIAFFELNSPNGLDIYKIIWSGIEQLTTYCTNNKTLLVRIVFSCFDGEGNNRTYVSHHKREHKFNARHSPPEIRQSREQLKEFKKVQHWAWNAFTGNRLYFISDPPHLIKKLRNNWYNSGITDQDKKVSKQYTRILEYNTHRITWDFIERAVIREFHRPFRTTKLTEAHAILSNKSKMNCSLAFKVFTEKVLDDLKLDAEFNDGVKQYMRWGIDLKKIFLSATKIDSVNDPRLARLKAIAKEFDQWTTSTPKYNLPSSQCCEDLQLATLGFVGLITYLLEDELFKNMNLNLIPKLISQDCCENWFSQQRSIAQNTNPNVAEYRANNGNLKLLAMSKVPVKSSYSQNLLLPVESLDNKLKTKRIIAAHQIDPIAIQQHHANVVAKISQFKLVQDQPMIDTVNYCAGYVLSKVHKHFKKLKSTGRKDMVKKLYDNCLDNSVTAKKEFVSFLNDCLCRIHVGCCNIQFLTKHKENSLRFAIEMLKQDPNVQENWESVEQLWKRSACREDKEAVFNQVATVWVRMWLFDCVKKAQITPKEGEEAFRQAKKLQCDSDQQIDLFLLDE